MPTNRKEHLRFRYGICLNDGCEKCKSKEVQQIAARKDFVCEACQKPLRECPPPKSFWDKYGKLIIAAVVVVAAIVVLLFLINRSKGASEPPVKKGPDSTTVIKEPVDSGAQNSETDTVTDAAPKETPAATPEAKPEPKKVQVVPTPVPKVSAISVPFGTYSGPANGLNGTIRVNRHYSLSLRNAAHETIELQPGDVISQTQFRNGELVTGYLQSANGNRSFHR